MRPTVIGVKLGAALVIALGVAGGGTVAYALTASPVDRTSAATSASATTDSTETETADPTETETADPTETETADPTETETADPTETETADPTETEKADPTETETKGPDATGPAARGLCTAWTHHQGRSTGKSADSTAFRALTAAAGGQDQVGSYCATVLGTTTRPEPSETEDQGGTHRTTASGSATTHGTSGGSHHATRRNGQGTEHAEAHGKGHGKGH